MNSYENHWLNMPEPADDEPVANCSVCGRALYEPVLPSYPQFPPPPMREDYVCWVDNEPYCPEHKPREDGDD